jgi:hypothetical protein
MAWRVSNKILNEMFGAVRTQLANGVIYVYSGSQPASAHDAPTGTLLGRATKNAGAWTAGSPTNGLNFAVPAGRQMTKASDEVWQFVGLAKGTAGWGRFVANAADPGTLDTTETYPRIDGRIAVSGAEINMSNLNVEIGAVSTIDSYTHRWPTGVL